MPVDNSICPRCEGDNLTDYPVCPGCAKKVHFTHRDCAHCAKPIIEITRQPLGHYKMVLPFEHDAFLDDFKTRIGKRFRTWHVPSQSWNLTPLDAEMIKFIAGIVQRHFRAYDVRIVEEPAVEKLAA